jgi:DNA-binding NtrC family response regulator
MKRILLVDDDEDFRLFLRETLESAGYLIETAAEGRGALRLVRRQAFDLVVTDLIMPGKEGLETIVELHGLNPGLKIIAISGGGWLGPESCLAMAQQLGAASTLVKPFTSEEILESVGSVLNS